MKSYPSIITIGNHFIESGREPPLDLTAPNWIGFVKLDGSIIRAEWKRGKGFYKFGRKNGLLDDSNPWLQEAPELMERDYSFLQTVFTEFGWTRVVAFFEFLGKHSFAGNHEKEKHGIHLIDISTYKKGLIDPKDLAIMDAVGGAKPLHRGPVTPEVIRSIHESKMKGMSFEGVVFKRINRKGIREMFKTKSSAWYERLREKCAGNKALEESLR